MTVGALFEDMPVTRRHWQAGLALFFVFVIESWEMMVLVLGAGSVGQEFGLDATRLGSLISAIFLGMIPGALLWGRLIDRLGRKRSIMSSLLLYSGISFLSALSPDIEALWWLRFAVGMALSGVLVVTFPYFEELLPVRVRGRAAVYLASGWPVGLLISIGVAYAFGDMGWRWMVGVSASAGLWVIVVQALVPESPYWLATRGRDVEAKEVLVDLSGMASLRSVQLAVPMAADASGNRSTASALELLRNGQFKVTLVQLIINFCFSWGYWGLSSWMPMLLAKRGLSAPQGLGFMALSALFMFPGYVTASWFTGRYGRKSVMLAYVMGATLAGFGFAQADSMATLYGLNFALSFFSLGAWGVWNTWMGEIYGTRLRAMGYGAGIAAQRIANTAAPVVVGSMVASSSFTATVSFIATFLAATLVALLFLRETEGHALE